MYQGNNKHTAVFVETYSAIACVRLSNTYVVILCILDINNASLIIVTCTIIRLLDLLESANRLTSACKVNIVNNTANELPHITEIIMEALL